MGVSYTTTIGFGVLIPEDWVDAFNEKQDDYYDGFYEWIEKAVTDYDTLAFEDSGNYYWSEGVTYALVHKDTARSSYDAGFVAAPFGEFGIDVDQFTGEVASFYRRYFDQWQITAADIEPKWYAGMRVS